MYGTIFRPNGFMAASSSIFNFLFQSIKWMTSSGRDMATPPSPASAVASGRYSMLTVSPLRTTAVLIGFERATPPTPAFALADGLRYILVTGLSVATAVEFFTCDACTTGSDDATGTTVFLSQLGPPTLGVFECIGLTCVGRRFWFWSAAASPTSDRSSTSSTTVTRPLSKFTATDPLGGDGIVAAATADPVPLPVPATPGQTPNVGTNAQYGSRYLRIQ